jgi:hypothetical protein
MTTIDKSTAMRSFNTLFFSFLDLIIELFPGSGELIIAKRSFDSVKTMNVSLLVKIWYQYVYIPYSARIFEDNLDYFLDKDYNEDVSGLANSREIVVHIQSFKQKIKTMSHDNRLVSLDYLKSLCRLSKCYAEGGGVV